MTRIIVIALLLLVFFFGGVTYGTLQTEPPSIETNEVNEVEIDQTVHADSVTVEEELNLKEKEHFIHKIAGFFEGIFSICYEIMIQALYKVANSFFE